MKANNKKSRSRVTQRRADGTLVTCTLRNSRAAGFQAVLRTFESRNLTELNIYPVDKEPVFLSGRQARQIFHLLKKHYASKKA